jgi:DNA-binding response OmpR family regulator
MIMPLSILFADRDLAATRPHRMNLRRHGARVDIVETAADVLRRAAQDPPDLLVLDERLQAGADEDVISVYRKKTPETEVILLQDGGDTAPHGMGMGLLFSARKPVSCASLQEIIDDAFPGRLTPGEGTSVPAPSILCVDDDRAYLGSLARTLRRRGYPVVALESAQEALAMLPRFPFAVVLVDIMMAGMDGIGLTHEIHQQSGGRISVIVLTGLASDEATYLALENGARFCLTKTCETEELLNVVDFVAGMMDSEERRLLEQRLAASALPKTTA